MTEASRHIAHDLTNGYMQVTRFMHIVVACTCFTVMVSLNVWEISLRYFVGRSLGWSQEINLLLAMWLYFFTYALIAKDEAYIRMDLILTGLGPRAQHWLRITGHLVVIGFQCAVLVFAVMTIRFVMPFRTNALEWPEYLFYLPVVVGATDLVLTECIHLGRRLKGGASQRASEA